MLLTRAQIEDIQSRDLTPGDLQMLSELCDLDMVENTIEQDSVASARSTTGLMTEELRMLSELRELETVENTIEQNFEQDVVVPDGNGSWRRTASGWRTGVPTMDAAATACLATPDSSTWIGESCPFCLEDLQHGDEVCALPRCQHVYHRACLQPWLARKAECPLCRTGL